MTEFAHAVNFRMSFGMTVLPEDINKMREWLEKSDQTESLWNIEINKNSSDEEIANYLGVENYRDHLLAEVVDMEMEEHHIYDKGNTERLRDNYQRQIKEFREINGLDKSQQSATKVSTK